jgi:type IV secretion system protein VirB10
VIGGEQPPAADPVQEDKKKRQYLSLFAPNVAFTFRKGTESEKPAGQGANQTAGNQTSPVTDIEGQLRNAQTQFERANRLLAQPSQPSPPNAEGAPQPKQATTIFNSFAGKRFVLFEGTVIEALLINRLNGTFSGPVNCLVTNDVYSHDHQHVLIPAGTKLLGETKKIEALGQQRLAVFFHRVIMPDGFSASLDEFKGLNQVGETALRDKVNNHYLQIFGASLAIGILGGVAEAGTGSAFTNSPLDRARAGMGSSLATSSAQILDKFLNILPTVTIREGNRVKVYLSGDLLLPDYAQHTMQPDL